MNWKAADGTSSTHTHTAHILPRRGHGDHATVTESDECVALFSMCHSVRVRASDASGFAQAMDPRAKL